MFGKIKKLNISINAKINSAFKRIYIPEKFMYRTIDLYTPKRYRIETPNKGPIINLRVKSFPGRKKPPVLILSEMNEEVKSKAKSEKDTINIFDLLGKDSILFFTKYIILL